MQLVALYDKVDNSGAFAYYLGLSGVYCDALKDETEFPKDITKQRKVRLSDTCASATFSRSSLR